MCGKYDIIYRKAHKSELLKQVSMMIMAIPFLIGMVIDCFALGIGCSIAWIYWIVLLVLLIIDRVKREKKH